MTDDQKTLLSKWISAADYIAPDLPLGLKDLLESLAKQSREALDKEHLKVLSVADMLHAESLKLTKEQIHAWATVKRRYIATTQPAGGHGCVMIGCFYDDLAFKRYEHEVKAGRHQEAANHVGIWLGIEPDGYTHS